MGWEGVVESEAGEGSKREKEANRGTFGVPGMGEIHLQGHVCLNQEEDH
jgi:hypothetical protein